MPPELTDAQRREALAIAMEARRMRQTIKRCLKAGTLDPARALAMEGARRMRVRDFLRALPGMGGARADGAMERLGISARRCVGGLGPRQLERLVDWIEGHEH